MPLIRARRSGRDRMDAINQPLLDVRDLSVAFGDTLAVDQISFSIRRGECVALVGESGSGKSVCALSILKLLPYPSASHPSGSIRFGGRDLLQTAENEMREIRGGDISIIFQEPMTSLKPLHTIEAQIGEILFLHNGVRGAMARARTLELLTQVGIPDPHTRLQSYPHQLSGGQRQRVMIAMALANEPVVMSADNLKVWFPVKRGLLRRTVDHIRAVDGVSLAVRKGETLGVVGESGSGKTTLGLALLRLISSEGP